jgi:hypothetical protein
VRRSTIVSFVLEHHDHQYTKREIGLSMLCIFHWSPMGITSNLRREGSFQFSFQSCFQQNSRFSRSWSEITEDVGTGISMGIREIHELWTFNRFTSSWCTNSLSIPIVVIESIIEIGVKLCKARVGGSSVV